MSGIKGLNFGLPSDENFVFLVEPLKRSTTLIRKEYIFFICDNSSLSRSRLRISLNQNLASIKFLTHPTSPYSFKKWNLATIVEFPHFFHAKTKFLSLGRPNLKLKIGQR